MQETLSIRNCEIFIDMKADEFDPFGEKRLPYFVHFHKFLIKILLYSLYTVIHMVLAFFHNLYYNKRAMFLINHDIIRWNKSRGFIGVLLKLP